MGTYVTVASVRRTSGIGTKLVGDTDVEATITEAEAEIPRVFNTVFTPKERIDVLDGNGTNRVMLMKTPLLAVRQCIVDDTTVTPAYLNIYKESGKVELNSSESVEVSTFKDKTRAVKIKYIFGDMEESSTSTTSSAASTAGTSVALSVASETDFAADDWVEVYGMDGYREAAKVSSTATGVITVDQLVYSHESGSTIVKLQVNANFTKLMNIVCAIALVARVVGESYDETVGFNLGELHVQKGEPYTQWRETATQLIREREFLLKRIIVRPFMMS